MLSKKGKKRPLTDNLLVKKLKKDGSSLRASCKNGGAASCHPMLWVPRAYPHPLHTHHATAQYVQSFSTPGFIMTIFQTKKKMLQCKPK